MKVLYVENGSERDKRFQLQTMIYEKDGKKFAKKSVLYDEALPHLDNMKENYIKFSQSIINPKVKLAKIVDSDKRSLTFEFIEGVSLAKKFEKIVHDKVAADSFIEKYIDFLKSSFKTTIFDSKKVTDGFRELFGNFDYSVLDGEVCFDGISNIDLIFSNIIYKNDEIYIIDYEWGFECSVPINYILYRLSLNSNIVLKQERFHKLYKDMESNFIWNYVYKESFYKNRLNYNKNRPNLEQTIKQKNQLISEKEWLIQKKDHDIKQLEELFYNREQQLHEKSLQIISLQELAESMRIKNRIKKILGIKFESVNLKI